MFPIKAIAIQFNIFLLITEVCNSLYHILLHHLTTLNFYIVSTNTIRHCALMYVGLCTSATFVENKRPNVEAKILVNICT